MSTMRSRFYELAARALDDDPRVAIVAAEIGLSELPDHPRLFNVGIREQLMIGVAAGLAREGMRPIVHSYTPFLVERPYEQIKLDLGHQDVGAILVSTGASYDSARSGRTHQAPGDVAVLSALPGWTIHVPGHPDELEQQLHEALRIDDRVYIRMSEEVNNAPVHARGLVVLRRGSDAAPVVLAVGRRSTRCSRPRATSTRPSPTCRPCGRSMRLVCARSCAAPTWCSSSPTWPARRRRWLRARSLTVRIGCWRSGSATSSCAGTEPAPTTAPPTASTRTGSAARSPASR